jgi:hypothetical protein
MLLCKVVKDSTIAQQASTIAAKDRLLRENAATIAEKKLQLSQVSFCLSVFGECSDVLTTLTILFLWCCVYCRWCCERILAC